MPACNIIVDSCVYFRLAQSIRPLLKNPFGKEKYCLGVIQELDKEYGKNPSLKRIRFESKKMLCPDDNPEVRD
jgi:hypothetical protein